MRKHWQEVSRVTGATVHFVDTGTDTGPIILQKAVKIKSDDTPEILQRRVMEEAEWKILPKAINLIANGRVTVTEWKSPDRMIRRSESQYYRLNKRSESK